MKGNKNLIFVISSESYGNHSGGAVVINKLLSNFRHNEIIYLGINPTPIKQIKAQFKTYYLPKIKLYWRLEMLYRYLSVLPAVICGLYILLKHKPKVILSFYPFENALIASLILSKVTKTPLYTYMNDLYKENREGIFRKKLANYFQSKVFKYSNKIIVVNSGMADFYNLKYNIQPEVIFTSINEGIPEKILVNEVNGKFIFGYSGNINNDRIDVFKTMVAALGKRSDIEIRIFSATTKEELVSQGAWSSNMYLDFIKDSEKLVNELRKCHALYLPLTFSVKNTSVDQLATCLGIKSYEYLIAGAPVIIQCREEYYTAKFYKDRDCGIIVSENTESALIKALDLLISDKYLRQKLVDNSLLAAKEFTGIKNKIKLNQILNMVENDKN
jgi:glycosyltransferase involved in cell wall biosynthesis